MKVFSLELTEAVNFIVSAGPDGTPLEVGADGAVSVSFDGRSPALDFSNIGVVGVAASVAVSDRAKDVLAPLLGEDAVFIPLATDQGSHWGFRVVRDGPFDLERSETSLNDDGLLQIDRGVYKRECLKHFYAFHRPGDPVGGPIYLTQRFLDVVVAKGLTGLNPMIVWDSEETVWRPTEAWPQAVPPGPVSTDHRPEGPGVLGETEPSEQDRVALATLLPLGYTLIGLGPADTSQRLGEAVQSALTALQTSKEREEDIGQTITALGFVVGELLCRVGGWEWARLDLGNDSILAVVEPTRARYVEPFGWLAACVEVGTDCGILGLVVGIEKRLRLPGGPGAYWPLP